MATEVRLKYTADIADLKAKLASIPGITAAEARKSVAELNRSLKRAEREQTRVAQSVGQSWKQMGSQIKIATAAVAGLVVGFAAYEQKQADLVNEINDMSARTGQSADALIGWKLAAQSSGQSLRDLDRALGSFPKRMADAAMGIGDAKKAFDRMGISVTDADGNLRDATEVTNEFFTRLQGYSDVDKAALATQAFGRAGGKLVQALGDRRLSDFEELAKRFGVSVGPEASAAAANWQAQTALLKTAMEGLGQSIGGLSTGANVLSSLGQSATFVFTFIGSEVEKVIGSIKRFASTFAELADVRSPMDLARAVKDIDSTLLHAGSQVVAFRGLISSTEDSYAAATAAAHKYALASGLVAANSVEQQKAAAAAAKEDEKKAKNEQAAAEAAKRRLEAERAAAQAAAEAAQHLADQRKALADLRGLTESAQSDELSAEEKIIAARDKALAQARDLGMASGDRAAASEAMAAIEERAERDIAAAREQADEQAAEAAKRAHDERMQQFEDEAAAARAYAFEVEQAVSDTAGGFADLFAELADEQASSNADAAKRWFQFYQGAAIAQAIIDGASATLKAYAELGPIGGTIAAAGLVAETAATIAQIKAQELPSYPTGGMVQVDHVPVLAQPGEAVISRRGVAALGGPSGVADVNAGATPSASPRGVTIIESRIDSRVLDRRIDEGYGLSRSALRSRIRARTRRIGIKE